LVRRPQQLNIAGAEFAPAGSITQFDASRKAKLTTPAHPGVTEVLVQRNFD